METSNLNGVLSSPEVQAFANGFPVMMLHLVVTFGLLAVAATVYAFLTPWREVRLIRQGNTAAATGFAAVLLSLAIPLAVSLAVSSSLRDIVIWGVATVVLQLLVFRVVDLLLNGLPQRIERGEVSAAVVLAGAKIATSLIIAASLTG
ncbi:DUF350 domain-containing protein [Brevundimonas terrae]|uniref:DUF350 domain-containing protein n=1 Tax=Brevundimonas terrae TaxID=363631 RepID=A0ABP3HT72_9CAUL|nr:DUF350 domain-containing protein [Brevundimonas terrae]NIJ26150.1 putative membrane protein [Brevundimonas terrae]